MAKATGKREKNEGFFFFKGHEKPQQPYWYTAKQK